MRSRWKVVTSFPALRAHAHVVLDYDGGRPGDMPSCKRAHTRGIQAHSIGTQLPRDLMAPGSQFAPCRRRYPAPPHARRSVRASGRDRAAAEVPTIARPWRGADGPERERAVDDVVMLRKTRKRLAL
jgi:hypothetical protein